MLVIKRCPEQSVSDFRKTCFKYYYMILSFLPLALQVACGLAALHSMKILHRGKLWASGFCAAKEIAGRLDSQEVAIPTGRCTGLVMWIQAIQCE